LSFFLIKGSFYAVGYEPDGDSARFKADNADNWKKLDGAPVDLKSDGKVQLRFDAIDALETHYSGQHQPMEYAGAARDYLLSELLITNVQWAGRKVASAQEGSRGYILTKTTDNYLDKRPVSFVFTGDTNQADGSEMDLDQNKVQESVNYKIIQKGLAFPTYYSGLPQILIDQFTEAVVTARNDKIGIWPYDKTNTGVTIGDIPELTDKDVILPKLFRRLISFNTKKVPENFQVWLKHQKDKLTVENSATVETLDQIMKIDTNKVALTEKPEKILFIEKG